MNTHPYSAKPADYAMRLKEAKRGISNATAATDPVIAPQLLESWQRSYAQGIYPSDQKLTAPDYPLHLIDDHDRQLSSLVGDEIDAIWDSFGGENWVVYCSNAQGLIIRARHGTNPASRGYALHVGRRIQEGDIGTTAPSCALLEQRPVTLVGAEHYLEEFEHMFCCAVPIWGPWGALVGVINITGSEEFKSRLIEKKLTSAAIKIENRLFVDIHRSNSVFKIHYDADFIDTHLAGLVAVNIFGDILSATRNALEMLDHIDPFTTRYNVADLFMGNFVAADGYCLKSSLKNGIVFYTKTSTYSDCGDLRESAAARVSSSLRDFSDLHMLETLRNVGGNVSKAAKVLGVSRNTLYRAIRKQQSSISTPLL